MLIFVFVYVCLHVVWEMDKKTSKKILKNVEKYPNCVVLYICVCLCLFACSVGNGQNVAHFTPFLGWLRMRCVTEVCDRGV